MEEQEDFLSRGNTPKALKWDGVKGRQAAASDRLMGEWWQGCWGKDDGH